MSEKYTFVSLKRVDKLCLITFDNQKKLNPFDQTAYKEVTKALNDAAENPDINVVAVTGAGNFFSSGNDLSRLVDKDSILREISTDVLRDFTHAFIDFPKLLVAIVNGPAIGIGATLCGLCDIVYASNTVNITLILPNRDIILYFIVVET